jgi:hypothetical protein
VENPVEKPFKKKIVVKMKKKKRNVEIKKP